MSARAMMIVFAAAMAGAAQAQSVVPQSVVASGGTRAGSASFALNGTAGQTVIGTSGGPVHVALHGYWYQPDPIVTAVGDPPAPRPALALEQNHPNPFHPTTTIAFSLPEAGRVRLVLLDVSGAAVLRALDRALPSGTHRITLDATGLPAGIYFYRLEAAGLRATRKLVVLR
jgi:hypothetical protein